MPQRKRIDSIIETISSFRPTGDDYLDQLEELCDEIEGLRDGKQAMKPLFSLLEKYPKADFGAPGPIAHLLETYYKKGYENALLRRRELVGRMADGAHPEQKAEPSHAADRRCAVALGRAHSREYRVAA